MCRLVCKEQQVKTAYSVTSRVLISGSLHRVVIFGHFSTHRDPRSLSESLAGPLLEHNTDVQHVILTACPSAQRNNNGLSIYAYAKTR